MKKNEKMNRGQKVVGIGIWLIIGIIVCAFIILKSQGENVPMQQQATDAVKTESAKTVESPLPAFKKEAGLSVSDKMYNPLIMNHVGTATVVTNMRGERLGVEQKIYLSQKEFDSITAKNLKDFWLECNFDGWMNVWILEKEANVNSGRAMVITSGGKTARYGYVNADEKAGLEFGKFYKTIREFFYLSDENDFQYFNSDDPDDAGLKRFKDSDKVFATKVN